jgi:hypothetical protein
MEGVEDQIYLLFIDTHAVICHLYHHPLLIPVS